jgi:hypothetical protein
MLACTEGKQIHTHIHNGMLFSHKKKEIPSFAATWMEVKDISLREIQQTQKGK